MLPRPSARLVAAGDAHRSAPRPPDRSSTSTSRTRASRTGSIAAAPPHDLDRDGHAARARGRARSRRARGDRRRRRRPGSRRAAGRRPPRTRRRRRRGGCAGRARARRGSRRGARRRCRFGRRGRGSTRSWRSPSSASATISSCTRTSSGRFEAAVVGGLDVEPGRPPEQAVLVVAQRTAPGAQHLAAEGRHVDDERGVVETALGDEQVESRGTPCRGRIRTCALPEVTVRACRARRRSPSPPRVGDDDTPTVRALARCSHVRKPRGSARPAPLRCGDAARRRRRAPPPQAALS